MKTIAIVWVAAAALFHAAGIRAQSVLPPARPTPSPTFPSYSQRPIDETYRIGGRTLSCIVADGNQVRINIARGADNFAFLAVGEYYGRAILVNERRVASLPLQYAIFSFFRECAVHSLTDVTATRDNTAPGYSSEIIAAADCLAIVPTLQELAGQQVDTVLDTIVRGLQQEYGGRYPISRAGLTQCTRLDYAREVANRVRSSPRR